MANPRALVRTNSFLLRPFLENLNKSICRRGSILNSNHPEKSLVKQNDEKPKQYERKAGRFRSYVFSKFMAFIEAYENVLERKFPRVYKIYRIFMVGTKEFYIEAIDFARIAKELRAGKTFRNLSHREIEVYHRMPKEMLRVAPMLILTSLPLTNYIVFPLAYWFPRYLLSSHFWNLQQRMDFAIIYQKKKLYYYRPTFRYLQAKLNSIEDASLQKKCAKILHKIGSGVHPEVEEILATRILFEKKPYSLSSVSIAHVIRLCKMHGLSPLSYQPRKKLWLYAGLLREMDLAIGREKMEQINPEELRKILFLRGLNPVGMQQEDMIRWLQQWITISRSLNSRSLSLLLHCPILLAYNQPTNWSLIH